MALNYTTITETFKDGSGAPLSNVVVTFTPSGAVYSASTPVATPASPVQAQVVNGILKAADGVSALELLATDNTGLTFAGLTGFFYWTVSVNIGGAIQSWSFFLPHTPATVDLYSLANTASGGSSGFTNPMTTLGDIIYENATPAAARLAGSTSAAKQFLTQTGTGSVSAAPAWGGIAAADVPGVDGVTVTGTPTTGQVPTATSGSAATWQSPASVDQPYQFRPENYGAKGDGKVARVSVTTGSAVINTTPIGPPGAAPTLSNTGSGGSLTAGTYQVEVTFVNQWGESLPSAAGSQAISGTQPLTISSPTPTQDATGYYAYVTQAGGSTFTRQQTAGSPTPIGASLVLTANPSSGGANPPASDTTAAQVFTSTAVDGGKNIMICGGLGVPGSPYLGTIASVQSATQATLSDTSIANTVSGAAMVFSSDDRTAFDNCVTAAKAYALANDYLCEIVLKDKIYGLGSGLFQNSIAANGIQYNTQLRIPVPNQSGQTRKLEFRIIGPGENTHAQFWVSALPDLSGAAIVTYSLGPSSPDPTFGQQSVIGGPTGGTNYHGSNTFGNTVAVIKGVQVVTGGWCNTIGIDLALMSGCVVRGSVHAFAPSTSTGGGVNPSNSWVTNSSFQSTFGTGLQLPNELNNDDTLVESFTVEGMRNGVLCQADHAAFNRLCTINVAVALGVGVVDSNAHALTVNHWSFENCVFALDSTQSSSGHIMCDITMDGENTSCTDVHDGNPGFFYGIVRWDDPFRSPATPTIVGALNLKVINNQLGVGHMSSPPSVPATTVSATPVYKDAWVTIHTGAGVTVSAVTIDGTATGLTLAASSTVAVRVPSGKTIALTYAGGTPTWDWWLE